nr:MAG TPA: hypothetical protein [Bacteriophage sp.]
MNSHISLQRRIKSCNLLVQISHILVNMTLR